MSHASAVSMNDWIDFVRRPAVTVPLALSTKLLELLEADGHVPYMCDCLWLAGWCSGTCRNTRQRCSETFVRIFRSHP